MNLNQTYVQHSLEADLSTMKNEFTDCVNCIVSHFFVATIIQLFGEQR